MLGGCQVFPTDNPWNEDVSGLAVRSDSAAARRIIERVRAHRTCTPTSAIARTMASRSTSSPSTQALVPINYIAYGDESDPGPFPDPDEEGVDRRRLGSQGDRHVLMLQQGTCRALRVVRRAPQEVEVLERRLGRDVGLVVERAATVGLDVGRRRRVADPARARALRRGRDAATSTTRCGSPSTVHSAGTSCRRRTSRRRRPIRRCRRWACGCGLKAIFDLSPFTARCS